MDIRDFISGHYIEQTEYRSFLPCKVDREWIVSDPEIATLLEEATRKLGALNVYSVMIPDVNAFLRIHILKEATTSSKIEGTQTPLEEAVLEKVQVTPEKHSDWQEVHNYLDAMNFAIKQLHK